MSYQTKDRLASTGQLSFSQLQQRFSESRQVSSASSTSSGYHSQISSGSLEIQKYFVSEGRIVEDSASSHVRFYAKGPDRRALCVWGKDVLLLADTGEDVPSREYIFVLVDKQPYDKMNISGTKAQLQTVKGRTNVVLYIPDADQPEKAELRTASNAIPNGSSTILSEVVIYDVVVHEENCPQITIYYPGDRFWYYIVPGSDSNSITVEPKKPCAEQVKKYMFWSYGPFE